MQENAHGDDGAVAAASEILARADRYADLPQLAPEVVGRAFLAREAAAREPYRKRGKPWPFANTYRKMATFLDSPLNKAWPCLSPDQKRAVRRAFEERACHMR